MPERFCHYENVGKEIAKAMIGSSGSRYIYRSGPKWQKGKFEASEVITDWVHSEFSQTLGFSIELRPRVSIQNENCFEVSPDEIIPTSNEAFSALRILLSFSNNQEKFLSAFPSFNECRRRTTTTARNTPLSNSSTNIGVIVGAVVGDILAVLILFIFIMCFRVKRRRSREKQLEEVETAPSDDCTNDGAFLESLCVIIKRLDTNAQPGSHKLPVISKQGLSI